MKNARDQRARARETVDRALSLFQPVEPPPALADRILDHVTTTRSMAYAHAAAFRLALAATLPAAGVAMMLAATMYWLTPFAAQGHRVPAELFISTSQLEAARFSEAAAMVLPPVEERAP